MKRSNVLVLLLMILACRFTYAASENIAIPTEEQVQKLAAAAWKEPIKSIDVAFYKDYTTVPMPVEKIHKEIEQFFDEELGGRSLNELNSYEIESRNKNIELNVKNWVENQKFPRKTKKQVRISGDNRRSDFVTVGPNEPLGLDTSFVHTFVTTKDANTGEFVSYHYTSEMNTVFIEVKKPSGETIDQFVSMPFATALTLRLLLGIDQGSTPKSLNYIPDPNKMADLVRTGLTKIVPREAKYAGNTTVYRIGIRPDPNSPDTREIVEMGDINHFPTTVLICDRKDYSCVYRTEIHIPTTNKIIYIRECGDFDSNGFPHNITEIKYDKDGNLLKKSVYRIIKVELNPLMPADVFEFHPSESYKVVDNRPKKP
jgi:hypothetical protein